MKSPSVPLARAWLALTAALAIHVADEATHNFLAVYNPIARRIQETIPFLPVPVFTFEIWLTGLIIAIVALAVAAIAVAHESKWAVRCAFAFSILMLLNGVQHIAGSIYMRSLMPGVLSAPVLLICGAWLLMVATDLHSAARWRPATR